MKNEDEQPSTIPPGAKSSSTKPPGAKSLPSKPPGDKPSVSKPPGATSSSSKPQGAKSSSKNPQGAKSSSENPQGAKSSSSKPQEAKSASSKHQVANKAATMTTETLQNGSHFLYMDSKFRYYKVKVAMGTKMSGKSGLGKTQEICEKAGLKARAANEPSAKFSQSRRGLSLLLVKSAY